MPPDVGIWRQNLRKATDVGISLAARRADSVAFARKGLILMRLKPILLPIFAILLLTAVASAVECACGSITQSCTMTSDLSTGGAGCLVANTTPVTIDCQGHSITGSNLTGSSSQNWLGSGIYVGYGVGVSALGSTIKNCKISNFKYGITVAAASGTPNTTFIINTSASSTFT